MIPIGLAIKLKPLEVEARRKKALSGHASVYKTKGLEIKQARRGKMTSSKSGGATLHALCPLSENSPAIHFSRLKKIK